MTIRIRTIPILFAMVLAATLLNAGPASAQTGVNLYIPNNLGNSVTVDSVDASGALSTVTTIGAGIFRPYAAAVSPDQRWVYVTLNTTAEMVVIDASTNTVVSTVSTGTSPSGVAVSPDGTKVWVCNLLSDSLSTFSVNTVTGALTPTGDISMGAGTRPHWLAFLPGGATAYVANVSIGVAGSVGVVDVASRTLLTTISAGGQLRGIAVNPSGTRAFATDSSTSNVRVIDTATNTQIGTLIANVTVPDGITVSRDGQWLYVANLATNTIAGYNAATLAPLPPVAAGSGPQGLVVTPDTASPGPVLYGTNTNSANVSGFAIVAGTGGLTPVVGSPFAVGSSPRFPGVCRTESGTFAAGAAFAVTVDSVPCIGANSLIAGGTLTSTGLPSISVPLALGTGGLIAAPAAGSHLTIVGVLSGTGGITKDGPGRFEVFGANTYSGATTVNAGGDFLLSGSTAASSAITVASGGTLTSNGTAAGPVTILGGGSLKPGRGGPGMFGTGNLALNANSFLEIQLNGPTAGTDYDRVNVTGTVTLGGTLTGILGFAPALGQVFLVINNDGVDPIGGTFAGQPEGSTVLIGASPFRVSYIGGDGNDVTLTLLALPTISTVASAGVALGASVSDTATIAGGAAPTGSITFRLYGPNDATCAGAPVFTDTKPVAGNGSYVSSSFTPTAAGAYRWIASYGGDANNSAAAGLCNDANESVTIAAAALTISMAFAPPAVVLNATSDATFTVTNPNAAAVTNVQFSNTVPAGVTLITQLGGTCSTPATGGGMFSINPGLGTFSSTSSTLTAGQSCTIVVRVRGTAVGTPVNTTSPITATGVPAGTAASATLTVTPAPQALTFPAQSPASRIFVPGATFPINPVATNAAPNSGNPIVHSSLTTAVCTVAGTTVTMVAAGTCTIAANQAGDANYAAATQVTQGVAIGVAAQTLTFAAQSPASRTFTAGATFAIGPVATSAAPNSGNAIVYSSLTAGVCTVAGTTVTMVAAGTCTIAANQAGDVNYAAATQVTQGVAIGMAAQTLTFAAQSPASRTFTAGATFAISPVATSAVPNSGNAIAYSSLTTGVCTVTGTTVTMVAVGTCTIAANQAGDANYAAATQVTQGVAIGVAPQTLTFAAQSPASRPFAPGATFAISPVATSAAPNSGNAIVYSSLTAGVCTVAGTTVTMVAVGTCTIAANQAGNGNFAAATQVTQGVAIAAAAVTSYTGPSATGSGTITASFTGGGAGCTFATSQFIPVTGHASSPPANVTPPAAFPHGLFDFTLTGCTPGSAVTMTVAYPAPLVPTPLYWKYGPTPTDTAPHWYVLPATIAGSTATFTITDGQLGDDDLAPNGAIADQGGPGVPIGTGAIQTPTLSEWATLLLAFLMLATGLRRRVPRRR